jgi:hypothetical protein
MDWIDDFKKRFSRYPELSSLKDTKFHGGLQINFCEGIPLSYDFKLHRKAVKIDEPEGISATQP